MSEVKVSSTPFGTLPNGTPVARYELKHSSGRAVAVIDYGAIITSIIMPDRDGKLGEITAGYPNLDGYLRDSTFQGAVVGRYANRIRNGRFSLDGVSFELPQNNGTNHLHGGPEGYYRAAWKGRTFADELGAGIELSLHSPDGDAGYPGALDVRVRYHLGGMHCLTVEYEARTTKPTVVNLTQHTYFNLASGGSIVNQELRVHAELFTPADERAIPTGAILPVAGTAFDFRDWRRIGEGIDASDPQIQFGHGYDHNFVIDGTSGELRLAAELRCNATGRRLNVSTTEPGMQFYSGNFLPKPGDGVQLPRHGFREALCLETQHFPDSPNQPAFPSTRLDPGQIFRSKTVFAFEAAREPKG